MTADAPQESRSPGLEVLLLGGQPLRENIEFYGPFVMISLGAIVQAISDHRAGRIGSVPATHLQGAHS